MKREKVVVILLLITIILSIASLVVTFSMNSDDLSKLNIEKNSGGSSASVELTLIEPPGETNEIN